MSEVPILATPSVIHPGTVEAAGDGTENVKTFFNIHMTADGMDVL